MDLDSFILLSIKIYSNVKVPLLEYMKKEPMTIGLFIGLDHLYESEKLN